MKQIYFVKLIIPRTGINVTNPFSLVIPNFVIREISIRYALFPARINVRTVPMWAIKDTWVLPVIWDVHVYNPAKPTPTCTRNLHTSRDFSLTRANSHAVYRQRQVIQSRAACAIFSKTIHIKPIKKLSAL